MTFCNNYHSAGIGRDWELSSNTRTVSPLPWLRLEQDWIQITPPTDQEHIVASDSMRHAYASIGLTFAHIPIASIA
jgi:hypothetical protein